MPRSRGSSGRSRPSAPAGSRSSSTAAAPAPAQARAAAPPPAQAQAGQPKQPGLLAQMASTAGGVAAGSVMGHGISNMLWGGRGEAAAPASAQTTANGGTCEFQAKEFTKCLDAADVQTCTWFLDQLKACQAAASQY